MLVSFRNQFKLDESVNYLLIRQIESRKVSATEPVNVKAIAADLGN